MIEPTDLDWLALCLVTESNRPEEWPAIAQVIENRRRIGRWGNTYRDVVLAPMQFSAFNAYTKPGNKFHLDETIFNGLCVRLGQHLVLMHAAAFCAAGPIVKGEWCHDISSATFHYWSPVSMKPPGSSPPWAAQAKRLYTPPGIDPERFVFAEGVP